MTQSPPLVDNAAPNNDGIGLLDVHQLSVRYGGVRALHGISVTVARGEVVAVLGANGAGKSTLLRAISGLVRPYDGHITLNGVDTTRAHAAAIARMGVAHVPEGRQVFNRLTVLDNLRLGAMANAHSRGRPTELERVFEIFPRLAERRQQLAGTLSGGEQQMLAIARALMASPSLMTLDEPSMGLSPKLVDVIYGVLRTISKATSILLVEQNVGAALRLATRGYVLETGNIVLAADSRELSAKAIHAAYLGDRVAPS